MRRGRNVWEIQKNGRISTILPDPVNAPAPLTDNKE